MPNYNFDSLSSFDFEQLTRDLLQKELSITLESFKSGRDRGIDLRYSPADDKTLIVQCKHFFGSGFDVLFRKLKNEERAKIEKLNPAKYFLATSVGMTPIRKQRLLRLLRPFCKLERHIYGAQDLNNLLGKFPEIEKKHFKLWLTSSAVLEKFIKSKIYNQTEFEAEQIKKKARLYVQNESFFEANEILKKLNYCLIVGNPGIGKTMLAQMLMISFQNKGYEIFVVSNDIDEAIEMYNPNKKQFFYYDDFLGQTSLQLKLNKNEDHRLVQFIESVNQNRNSKFVLTTREYILSKAKSSHEVFDRSNFDFKKCVVDLKKYTKLDRAKILFNHLYFSDIAAEWKADILSNKNYLKVINHANYSPRIIEWMTGYSQSLNPVKVGQGFTKAILENLQNPELLWIHALEHQLSEAARDLLIAMIGMPSEVYYQDMERVFFSFSEQKGAIGSLQRFPRDFKLALKEVEGNFVKIDKSKDNFKIEFSNPSIRDFLENYVIENSENLKSILSSVVFFEQLERLWSLIHKPKTREAGKRILMDLEEGFLAALERTFNSPSCELTVSYDFDDESICHEYRVSSPSNRFIQILYFFEKMKTKKTLSCFQISFEPILRQIQSFSVDKHSLMLLLKRVHSLKDYPESMRAALFNAALKYLMEDIKATEDYKFFSDFYEAYPEYVASEDKNKVAENLKLFCDSELLKSDFNDADEVREIHEMLADIGDVFDLDFTKEIKYLKRQEKELNENDDGYEPDFDDDRYDDSDEIDVDEQINDMFDSL